MKLVRVACISTAVLFVAAGAACNSGSNSRTDNPHYQHVGLNLEPSNRDVVVGDTVTITARTEDTYGRDSDLRWTVNGGDLDTIQDGRVARVKFDQPGTYTVLAVLSIDGKETNRASVDIHVKPLT